MSRDLARVKEIFAEAVDREGAERLAYLDAACSGDAGLRAEVDAYLAAAGRADGFLNREPPTAHAARNADLLTESSADRPASLSASGGDAATVERLTIREGPGARIGRYKLLQQIGEGGFGVVFMAEQERPVRRRVALKVIKLGMDTKQVIARFEAERQALAMMDHPNIAKVLDAGATETGRPYFVMELVTGDPITDYCDRNHLTIEERLELLVQVCQAVQHAHHKGIIHRDLKPSNVLVSTQDGRPLAKVIDFGIAKATAAQLTEKTLFTEHRQLIGTPQYMSPEQAGGSPDIDTRTDVYSLGVLTYELLTGATPFDPKELRSAAYAEMQRIIREVEPPKPSTKISQAHGTLPSVAALRKVEPGRLGKVLRGELDWIVMKALEKDRARRYETANALAMDLQRYLRDDAVLACPPSAAYRFGKFARRNKGLLIGVTAFVAVLLLAIVGLMVSNRMIATERNQKTQALSDREAALQEAEAQRKRTEVNFQRALVAVRDVMTRPAIISQNLPEDVRQQLTDAALSFYGDLLQDDSTNPTLRYETSVGYRALATLHARWGQFDKAIDESNKSIKILERLAAADPVKQQYRHQLAYGHGEMGSTLSRIGRRAEAKIRFQKSISYYDQLLKEKPDSFPYHSEATRFYRESMLVDPDATTVDEHAFKRTLELGNRALELFPDSKLKAGVTRAGLLALLAHAHLHRAEAAERRGELEEAVRDLRSVLDFQERARQAEPATFSYTRYAANTHNHAAELSMKLGRMKEAEAEYRDALRLLEEFEQNYPGRGAPPWDRTDARCKVVGILVATGQTDEAAAVLQRVMDANPNDHFWWYQSASLDLAAGHFDAYRKKCAAMLERFSQEGMRQPMVAERVSKTCAILPGAVPDFAAVEKLAQRAVTETEKVDIYRFFVFAKALSDYRAGRFEESVKWLEKFDPQPRTAPWDASAYAILAMDRQRLGRTAEAAAALDAAREIVAGFPNDPARVSVWHECVFARLLTGEAEKVLKKTGD